MSDYEQKIAKEIEEQKALNSDRSETVRLVASLLGARPKFVQDEIGPGVRMSVVFEDTLEVGFTFAPYGFKERLVLSADAWPTYKESTGRCARVFPRDIFIDNERQSLGEITVAINSAPEKIAKAINSRLLPEYRRLYPLCAERARNNEQYYLGKAEGEQAFKALFAKSSVYLKYVTDATHANIALSISLAQAQALMKIINDSPKEER